jgi:predicted O-linked N-acetylglucosamine transferase (SPINDLY family)
MNDPMIRANRMVAETVLDRETQLARLRDAAQSLYQQGRLAESLKVHEAALAIAPDAVVIRLSAARIAHSLELQETSLGHFEAAATIDPRCYPALEAARRICAGAGLAERAAHYARLAYAINPSAEALLSMRLTVPSIMDSVSAIHETRKTYAQSLDQLLAEPPRLEKAAAAIGVSAFFLAYHGENDCDLQVKAARLWLAAIPGLTYTAEHCRDYRRGPGKIRIGFISRFFAAHSIFSTSIGLVEKLCRETFEVIVLRITPSRDDACTARMRAAADRTLDLDRDLYQAREQIAALRLDILFYQDIGMEPLSYCLACARLAPVQCVSFGHPDTTGIPTLDYFISSDLFEPPGAEEHYSEKLVELNDRPTLAYYYKPAVPVGATRESFELPPTGIVVLIAGQFREFTDRLRRRFAQTLGEYSSRVVFLPFMAFDRFMQLLSCADVILDSLHFNGMNSSLQAFAVGTPVVTLPGRLQRGRHTQAMYRAMEIQDCIASDTADYVEIALRIARDPGYAELLRERILSRNHRLFEDARVVREFQRVFLEACDRAVTVS